MTGSRHRGLVYVGGRCAGHSIATSSPGSLWLMRSVPACASATKRHRYRQSPTPPLARVLAPRTGQYYEQLEFGTGEADPFPVSGDKPAVDVDLHTFDAQLTRRVLHQEGAHLSTVWILASSSRGSKGLGR